MAWFNTRNALTASVSVVPRDRKLSTRPKAKDRSWQDEAWQFFHTLGEIRFAARYIGNALARCRFSVGKVEAPGEPISPIEDKDPPDDLKARETIRRIRGRDGTFASLVRVYGVQQFISGESYLVAEDGLEGERWEFLSTSELAAAQNSELARIDPDATGDGGTGLGPNSLLIRFWQRDPELRHRADSPMRAVLDVCDGLRTVQAMQAAGDRSRLATAGLLLIPAEAELPKAPVPDLSNAIHQVGTGRLALLDQLLEVMAEAMDDPGSASAIVPIMVEMKADMIERVKRVTFERDIDATIVGRIDHLIRRLGQGLDIPPEILLGMGGLNHWTAWQVSEQTISAHIAPMAASFCEDLTVGFLNPTLELMKIDPEKYAIGFDPADLIVSPDRADHAFQLYDRFLLSGQWTLRTIGFPDDQIPTDKEIKKRIEIEQALRGAPPGGAPPGAGGPPATPPQPPEEAQPGPPVDGPPEGPDEEAPPDPADAKAKPAKNAKKQAAPKKAGVEPMWVLAGRMAGACDMAVDRAVERAGARLRSRGQGSNEFKTLIANRESAQVPMLLGPGNVERLGVTVDELFEGAWDGLTARLCSWSAQPAAAQQIVTGVDLLARRRLFDPSIDVLGAAQVLCETAVGLNGHEE